LPVRSRQPRIVIVGSGFSGLCLGIQLQKAGIDSFTILEKSDRLGGTWRDNTYPGAACDSPAFAYCFSFEQKTDWSRKWVPHDEILGYLEHCATRYGLHPHIRFSSEVERARFDSATGVWRVRTTRGDELEAEVLISATGQLNRPMIPDLAGLDAFAGEKFHSARWNHGCDLEGKTVGVIGNAASAIQFVPEIARRCGQLKLFQRSANWMLPRFDRAYSESEQQRFERHPWLARIYRWWIWLMHEIRFPVFRRQKFLSGRIQRLSEQHMRSVVSDPALQEALVPDYPIGGKRILISDDYYASLNRENVEVVTSPIERVTARSVVTRDGTDRQVDILVFATGFQTTSFLAPMEIVGLEGRVLAETWSEGARAYLGITVSGFPNFFMMYGPNTNLGHNSIIFMIECQARYVLDCIEALVERDLAYLDLREDVMEAYNARLQRELERTVWAATERSWYKDAAGKITNNWSGTTTRYWWRTRHADLREYRQAARQGAAGEQTAPSSAPQQAASVG
jgi:cation diffusion facilitator CzcD-associated flavoprotein CzcO